MWTCRSGSFVHNSFPGGRLRARSLSSSSFFFSLLASSDQVSGVHKLAGRGPTTASRLSKPSLACCLVVLLFLVTHCLSPRSFGMSTLFCLALSAADHPAPQKHLHLTYTPAPTAPIHHHLDRRLTTHDNAEIALASRPSLRHLTLDDHPLPDSSPWTFQAAQETATSATSLAPPRPAAAVPAVVADPSYRPIPVRRGRLRIRSMRALTNAFRV